MRENQQRLGTLQLGRDGQFAADVQGLKDQGNAVSREAGQTSGKETPSGAVGGSLEGMKQAERWTTGHRSWPDCVEYGFAC